jgi:hypothetical protein
MKTLLAIINEPKQSKKFLRYVARLAIDLQAVVKVLHVQALTNYPMGIVASTEMPSLEALQAMEKKTKVSKDSLEKSIKEIEIELSNNVFTGSSSEIGNAEVTAEQLVSENKVDMVVMEGQQDESFWTQTTTNMDVIQKVKCRFGLFRKTQFTLHLLRLFMLPIIKKKILRI